VAIMKRPESYEAPLKEADAIGSAAAHCHHDANDQEHETKLKRCSQGTRGNQGLSSSSLSSCISISWPLCAMFSL
jgi:hypothetical protein